MFEIGQRVVWCDPYPGSQSSNLMTGLSNHDRGTVIGFAVRVSAATGATTHSVHVDFGYDEYNGRDGKWWLNAKELVPEDIYDATQEDPDTDDHEQEEIF